MKKFIAFVCVAIASACFVGGAEKSEVKETPLGFTEAELIGTVKEIKSVNADKNLQFISVKLDGKPLLNHFFTDETELSSTSSCASMALVLPGRRCDPSTSKLRNLEKFAPAPRSVQVIVMQLYIL
jgi:hypothetical protein